MYVYKNNTIGNFRNPTPKKDEVLDNVTWLPVKNSEKQGVLDYLDINVKLSMKRNPRARNMKLWKDIYKKYGRPPFDSY